tara:strand:+ start:641 stop:1093 length:453 start_codon:yes stop_codon:yes gene_type:complete
MTVPASGELSLGKIGKEIRSNQPNNNYNNGPYTANQTALNIAENGGYGAVNSFANPKPSSNNPATMTEWYGYNHLTSTSDVRLKCNILFLGTSKSGIPIYEFSYINETIRWIGTMAQDLLRIGRKDAVTVMDNGYYGVYYDKIDIDNKIV